jgi:hypothetical protein
VKLKLKGFSVGRISATAVDALLGAGLRARH